MNVSSNASHPASQRGALNRQNSLSAAGRTFHLGQIPESVLRHIWRRQFLNNAGLITSRGKEVTVLYPGTLNLNAGPDFRDALIVIGGIRYRGDVEFHRTPEEWISHGHGSDPHYNALILHVVLESGTRCPPTRVEAGREVPLLALRPFLSAPLEKIIEHMEREESEIHCSPLACYALNDRLPAATLGRILIEYGIERLSAKTQRMAGRLEELCRDEGRGTEEFAQSVPNACLRCGRLNNAGIWEQLFAEGIMDGLGYSRNREPFRRLSQLLSISEIRRLRLTSIPEIESALFHVSGLMPSTEALVHPAEKAYVHLLSEQWKETTARIDERIHPTAWVLSPTRPSNLPTLRIAAAARLLFAVVHERLFERMIHVCNNSGLDGHGRTAAMESLLRVKDDAFWSRHYSFSESTTTTHSLLGISRRREIVMNTCIPLMLLYADVFDRDKRPATTAALAVGTLEENSVTRKMERQLIRGRYRISHGIEQQGLLHLYRTLCTTGTCDRCVIQKALNNTDKSNDVSVMPAETGIHLLDSCFRGNDAASGGVLNPTEDQRGGHN